MRIYEILKAENKKKKIIPHNVLQEDGKNVTIEDGKKIPYGKGQINAIILTEKEYLDLAYPKVKTTVSKKVKEKEEKG